MSHFQTPKVNVRLIRKHFNSLILIWLVRHVVRESMLKSWKNFELLSYDFCHFCHNSILDSVNMAIVMT